MNKKGFVFIETIMVLVMVVIGLLLIYKSYSLILTNYKRKENYENINDLYKLNIIKNIWGDTSFSVIEGYYIFSSNKNDTTHHYTNNCSDYMNTDCVELMNEMNINYVVLTTQDVDEILSNPGEEISNSLLVYLNTLDFTHQHLIISTTRYGEEYFASLRIR